MNKVQKILQKTFSLTDWIIEKPKDGLRKECYIVKNKQQTFFIKFDVPIPSLKRLGEIGVAPVVLFDGDFEGISYVIQEFINGIYPDNQWISQNLSNLANLIKIYHEDKVLISLLNKKKLKTIKTLLKTLIS